jgi:hypothetical protein
MYDKLNDHGILNDYDLAHLSGRKRPSGTACTGTMPFMALDLLTDDAWAGKIERRYRHDCESFAWVLLWICCRYDNGKEISNAPLGEFITHDYKQCFAKKYTIISKLKDIVPTASYECFWGAMTSLIALFIKQRYDREFGDLPSSQNAPPVEPTIHEMVKSCRRAMEGEGVLIFDAFT